MKEPKPSPAGRHPGRFADGEVRPERPVNSGRTETTADQEGIEIDNAIERPQEGQPGQRGAKPD